MRRSLRSERMKRMNSTRPVPGQPSGERPGLSQRSLAEALVGRAPAGRRVAVVGVVEGLESAGALAEVRQAAKALSAKEALVEGVVEVHLDGDLGLGQSKVACLTDLAVHVS